MIYHVSAGAGRSGDGTEARPFSRISDAAALARAGDTVLVAPGVYRECVSPRFVGTADAPIVYRSTEPLGAVITGAEPVTCWERYSGDVWRARISNGAFGAYNPYTTVIRGDWYFSQAAVHTGEVFLNGVAMYETQKPEAVLEPAVSPCSWEQSRSLYKWCTEQEGSFTVIYANFRGLDPNVENVEITTRRRCFFPEETGINYITVSGFEICKAATTWAPPTAFQDGMIGPHWSKGWVIEDCEIWGSRCSGISLGKYLQPNNENKWTTRRLKDGTQTERDAICQAQAEGWSKDTVGSHTVRRCHIHDCGQTGIVGHMGGVFSVIEDNRIHHINNKQDLAGAEIGGIKLHAAIDVIIRRNVFHHCTRGLWLDWQAQGTRVSQNLFYANTPPEGAAISTDISLGEDIFVEVSHGPTLIDNNLLLSPFAARLSTQGLAFVHNLIAGSFTYVGIGTDNGGVNQPTPRYTPYHMPHRTEVAGFMTILHGDARFYNNIFLPGKASDSALEYIRRRGIESEYFTVSGTLPYEGYPTQAEYLAKFEGFPRNRDIYYEHLPVYTGGNVYLGGAKPCGSEEDFYLSDEAVTLKITELEDGVELITDLYGHIPALATAVISTQTLGEAFEPEQRFEDPDGSPIIFDRDYFGTPRGLSPLPGPFAVPLSRVDL